MKEYTIERSGEETEVCGRLHSEESLIRIPHNDSHLNFIMRYPSSYLAERYPKLYEEIRRDGLRPPTLAETVSLLHQAYLGDRKGEEPEFKVIKNQAIHGLLYGFTSILYTERGDFIEDLPEIREGLVHMEESELAKRFEEGDPSVRFVPRTPLSLYPKGSAGSWVYNPKYKSKSPYSDGSTPRDFSSRPIIYPDDEYANCLIGIEGTRKLKEIPNTRPDFPYLDTEYWHNKKDLPLTKICAIHDYAGRRIMCNLDEITSGMALGILEDDN